MWWVRATAKWLGIAFLALLAGGAVYQQIGSLLDENLAPPAAEMISVKGRAVHLACMGHGPRTFILDAGLGAGTFEWWRLQPLLARSGRACAFDRAGLGSSAAEDSTPDGETAAAQLAELVRAAKIATPFVYVGHSLGANLAEIYFSRHPHDIEAMVLIEPGDPKDMLEDFSGSRADALAAARCSLNCYAGGVAAYLGVTRLAARIFVAGTRNLAGRARDEYRAGLARPSTVMTMIASFNAVPEIAYEDLDVRSFGDTPVLTVASSLPRDPEGKETVADVKTWRVGQLAYLKALADKSTRGEGPLAVPDSSHASMVMGGPQAAFLAKAINDFLSRKMAPPIH